MLKILEGGFEQSWWSTQTALQQIHADIRAQNDHRASFDHGKRGGSSSGEGGDQSGAVRGSEVDAGVVAGAESERLGVKEEVQEALRQMARRIEEQWDENGRRVHRLEKQLAGYMRDQSSQMQEQNTLLRSISRQLIDQAAAIKMLGPPVSPSQKFSRKSAPVGAQAAPMAPAPGASAPGSEYRSVLGMESRAIAGDGAPAVVAPPSPPGGKVGATASEPAQAYRGNGGNGRLRADQGANGIQSACVRGDRRVCKMQA